MTRDDIITLALEAGFCHDINNEIYLCSPMHIERFFQAVYAAGAAFEREKVAAWMIQRSYATGHGDTTEDLLKELDWQIAERVAAEREACADIVWPKLKVWSEEELTAMTLAFNRAQEKHGWYETLMAVGAAALKNRAAAIRARGQQ